MLRFVLVEPAVPENVGAAARALKTMGFGDLWIVNSDAHQQKQARILAHGSGELLQKARHFSSLADVKQEVDLVIGTSAVVYPAASLIQYTKSHGGKVIIINTQASGASHLADVELIGPCGEILPQLLS